MNNSTFRVNIYLIRCSTFGLKIIFNTLWVIIFQGHFSTSRYKSLVELDWQLYKSFFGFFLNLWLHRTVGSFWWVVEIYRYHICLEILDDIGIFWLSSQMASEITFCYRHCVNSRWIKPRTHTQYCQSSNIREWHLVIYWSTWL